MTAYRRPLLGTFSKQQIDELIKSPAHSILVGGGLIGNHEEVGLWLASNIEGTPELEVYAKDKPGSMELVRSIKQSLRSVSGASGRVLVIHQVHFMAPDAQNALLKLLEEPVGGVTLVLTARDVKAVLPTVLSRCAVVELQKPTLTEFTSYFSPDHDKKTIESAVLACGGRWDLLLEYLSDEDEHLALAKKLLGSQQYERLALLPELLSDREHAIRALEFVANIQRFLIHKDPAKQTLARLQQLEETIKTIRSLESNGSAKAQLTHLFAVL